MRRSILRASVIALALVAGAGGHALASTSDASLRPAGDCTRVDWHDPAFTPVDLDGDGRIACGSDMELGS